MPNASMTRSPAIHAPGEHDDGRPFDGAARSLCGIGAQDACPAANDDHRRTSERIAPDLPPAVGYLLVATFAWTFGTYLITFWGDVGTLEMIAVDIVYTLVYLGVPWLILRVEPKAGPNLTLRQFLDRGLTTYTGHVSGTEALIQILIIPVALAIATTALCLVWSLT